MIWKILCIGKPKLAFARAGIDEYLARIEKFGRISFHPLRVADPTKESGRLLEESVGSFRLVLDERGHQWSTRDFVSEVEAWEMQGIREVSVLIGGANGHHPDLRKAGDRVLALSRLTLQHELALLVFLEQLYRIKSIQSGSPYHRE